jgi:hypothetical protein
MAIKLWQRKQGVIRPPDEPLHGSPGSREFPETFRTRITQWVFESVGNCSTPGLYLEPRRAAEENLEELCRELAEAYGRVALVDPRKLKRPAASSADASALRQIPLYLSTCEDFGVLDVVDATFQKMAQLLGPNMGWQERDLLDSRAERFNEICSEEGVGYRWSDEELIRYDNAATHVLAIKPAMALLADPKYSNADAEFRRALECYRSGNWRDAITNANAAFESVLKLATGRANDTAGALIAEARRHGLIPGYTEAAAESLGRLMNVVPAVRGQQGSSHGLGDEESQADEHLAQLVLSTAAAFIVFIGRARQT